MNKFKFMLSQWSIVSGMFLGILLGVYCKGFSKKLAPIGELYFTILEMSVVPIMIAAVMLSISKLVRHKEAGKHFNKMILVFVIFLLTVSAIGVLVGMASAPIIGIDQEMRKAVGGLMLDKEGSASAAMTKNAPLVKGNGPGPHENQGDGARPAAHVRNGGNIFAGFAGDPKFKLLFFFMGCGLLSKFVPDRSGALILSAFERLFAGFQKVIRLAMYFLPLGLCALMASQFADIGFQILVPLSKLIVLIYAASLLIFVLSTIVLWKYTGGSYFRQFTALKEAIVIVLGTRSSFPALPSALTGLCDILKLERDSAYLVTTLGLTLCKYGKILIYCLGAVFAVNLYDYPLTLYSVVIIVVCSILTGMAASGAPGVVSRSMISMVLAPLGIPAGATIAILLIIDPIVDPIITLISTYPNYAAAAIISGQDVS